MLGKERNYTCLFLYGCLRALKFNYASKLIFMWTPKLIVAKFDLNVRTPKLIPTKFYNFLKPPILNMVSKLLYKKPFMRKFLLEKISSLKVSILAGDQASSTGSEPVMIIVDFEHVIDLLSTHGYIKYLVGTSNRKKSVKLFQSE